MAVELPPYTGWRPFSLRAGRHRHEGDRGSKRSRLGNAADRALYKSAKGHKQAARYAELCKVADQLNGNR